MAQNLLVFLSAMVATAGLLIILTRIRPPRLVISNYHGREALVAGGLCLLPGIIPGIIWSNTSGPAAAAGLLVVTLAGAVDDLYGNGQVRGFKGHLRAVAQGRPTTGSLKLALIGLVSIWFGAASFEGWGKLITVSLTVALGANCLNLLDLRPGRAVKAAWFWSLGLIILGLGASPLWALFLAGALLIYTPFDLGERVMLGDAGANLLGAFLGMVSSFVLPEALLLLLVLAIAAVNLYAEAGSLTKLIDSRPLLKQIDRWGRDFDELGNSAPKRPGP